MTTLGPISLDHLVSRAAFDKAHAAIFAIEQALPLNSNERHRFFMARCELGQAWDFLKRQGLYKGAN